MRKFNRLTSLCALLLGFVVSCGPDDKILDPPTELNVNAVTATSATLSWKAAPGINNFKLMIDDKVEVDVTGTSHTLTELEPFTKHAWKVKSVKGQNESNWVPGNEFTTEAPSLDKPTDLKVGALTATTAAFSWKTVDGVVKYALVVGNQAAVDFNGNSHTIAGLSAETEYSWKVRSVKGAAVSDWAAGVDFTTPKSGTGTRPNAPTDLKVSDLTDKEATLSWKHPNGQSHEVMVDGVSKHTAELTFKLTDLKPQTAHTWKVRTAVDGIWSDWAEGDAFTTAKETPSPTGLTVVEVSEFTAKLAWEHPDADAYQVSIDDGNPVRVTAKTYVATGFKHSTTHTWKVRAVKKGAWSIWSQSENFTTKELPVVNVELTHVCGVTLFNDLYKVGGRNVVLKLVNYDPTGEPANRNGMMVNLDIATAPIDDNPSNTILDIPAATYNFVQKADAAQNTVILNPSITNVVNVNHNDYDTSMPIESGSMIITGDHNRYTVTIDCIYKYTEKVDGIDIDKAANLKAAYTGPITLENTNIQLNIETMTGIKQFKHTVDTYNNGTVDGWAVTAYEAPGVTVGTYGFEGTGWVCEIVFHTPLNSSEPMPDHEYIINDTNDAWTVQQYNTRSYQGMVFHRYENGTIKEVRQIASGKVTSTCVDGVYKLDVNASDNKNERVIVVSIQGAPPVPAAATARHASRPNSNSRAYSR